MEWVDQYKNMLQTTLQAGELKSARTLVQSFHRTKTPYTAELCYLEAALCYYECRYVLALFRAEQGYQLDPTYAPLHEILGYLKDGYADNKDYKPTYSFDVSSANRPLRILIMESDMAIVNYTAELFKNDFETLGHETFVVHQKDLLENPDAFLNFIKQGTDFCLTFNNIGLCIRTQSSAYLWDYLQIPCFDYMFDHPVYYFDTFDNPPSSAIVTCVDRKHIPYIKRFYPKVQHSFYLPLGSEELPARQMTPWENRSIRALYVGSLKRNPLAANDEFSDMVTEYLCQNTGYSVEEAIAHCLSQLNPDEVLSLFPEWASAKNEESKELFLKSVLEKYRFCDINTNAVFREHLVRVLVEADIDVTVYGLGWEHCDFYHNPHFHYGGLISQEECLQKMQDTKFVLNSMPWFKDGTHDRIHNAMLAKALCVTDSSQYLKEQFTDKEDIVFYDLNEMEKLPDIIHYYEANPDAAHAVIEKGYEKTVLSHTWQNRSIELLQRFFQKDFD